MPRATDKKGYQGGVPPAQESKLPLIPTPITYKITKIAPGVTRASICALLEWVCGGTLVDTHFFGRDGINVIFSVHRELQHPDQKDRLASEIAALSQAASPLPLVRVSYESKPRPSTRLLRLATLARCDDGSIPDGLPEAVMRYVGVCAAHWVAGKVQGNVDLCMEMDSDTRQSFPEDLPQKRLEIMLQLNTPGAVQQALGLAHSSLDMLTVRYPRGYIYLYVSQSGHQKKFKWHCPILYSVTSRNGVPNIMPPPLNGCHTVEGAEHTSPPSNLPDDYDNYYDYNDYCTRVPAAGYDMPQHMTSLPSPTTTPQNNMVWSHNPYNLE